MEIMFEDYDKKFKSSTLKELESNVKILKNIFVDMQWINESHFLVLTSSLKKKCFLF